MVGHMGRILAVMILLGSCAGRAVDYRNYQARVKTFPVPQMRSIPFDEAQVQVARRGPRRRTIGRGIASVGPQMNPALFHVPRTDKRFYFVTLYGQYNMLKSFLSASLGAEGEIEHCPNFHTSFLEHKEIFSRPLPKKRIVEDASFLQHAGNFGPQSAAYYPEFNLPFSAKTLARGEAAESGLPKVGEVLQDSAQTEKWGGPGAVVARALGLHVQGIYHELLELCESGSSQNYYTYYNLSTHIQEGETSFEPSNKSMDILLKTRLFSNWALIQSFSQRAEEIPGPRPARAPASAGIRTPGTPASSKVYNEALVRRHGLEWVKNYFDMLTTRP